VQPRTKPFCCSTKKNCYFTFDINLPKKTVSDRHFLRITYLIVVPYREKRKHHDAVKNSSSAVVAAVKERTVCKAIVAGALQMQKKGGAFHKKNCQSCHSRIHITKFYAEGVLGDCIANYGNGWGPCAMWLSAMNLEDDPAS
jgi:hypothetical protein